MSLRSVLDVYRVGLYSGVLIVWPGDIREGDPSEARSGSAGCCDRPRRFRLWSSGVCNTSPGGQHSKLRNQSDWNDL